MENSMFQVRFQCGPPMAGPYGADQPPNVSKCLLRAFATSSHVTDVYGPKLSFRTASFLPRRFKWKMPNFCQVQFSTLMNKFLGQGVLKVTLRGMKRRNPRSNLGFLFYYY